MTCNSVCQARFEKSDLSRQWRNLTAALEVLFACFMQTLAQQANLPKQVSSAFSRITASQPTCSCNPAMLCWTQIAINMLESGAVDAVVCVQSAEDEKCRCVVCT